MKGYIKPIVSRLPMAERFPLSIEVSTVTASKVTSGIIVFASLEHLVKASGPAVACTVSILIGRDDKLSKALDMVLGIS